MFKIHKKVKYALIALKHIHSKPKGHLSRAKDICAEYRIPFDPTSRVLQIMAQQKILEAEQGAHGGYRLVRDLSKVSMFDLSRMIVGPLGITDCSGSDRKCSRREDCVLKDAMGNLNNRIHKVLKDVDISDMIGNHA